MDILGNRHKVTSPIRIEILILQLNRYRFYFEF
jgi:hypothetical protein